MSNGRAGKHGGAGITRRGFLEGLGAGLGVAAVGCGTDVDRPLGGADGGAAAVDAGRGPDAAAAADARADAGGPAPACGGSAGLTAEQLLAPIDTIVVLMMENRSFDHYLGSLSMREGRAVAGLTGSEQNPAPDGSMVRVFRLDDFTVSDPPHEWGSCHDQWDGGANDGFVRANAGADEIVVMGYHVREQIPAIYGLADAYALCDHWYASVMGPTWPNRFYLHGASSNGIKISVPAVGFPNVFSQLAGAGISARNYFHDLAWCSGGYFKLDQLATIEQFFDDAAAGTLPPFSIIDPQFAGGNANDDHPDHDVRRGQALIASVHAALARGPQWGRCLLAITYDEHGGFYDHVPPPTTVDEREEFRQLGFRVPSIVAGPFVARGCTVSTQLDHVSVLATVAKRFGLPPLNDRVAATNDLSVCIDPAFLSDPQPPIELPPVVLPRRPPVRRSLDGAVRDASRAHDELAAMADRGLIPRHLDRRAEGDAIAERVLAWGRKLGAVR